MPSGAFLQAAALACLSLAAPPPRPAESVLLFYFHQQEESRVAAIRVQVREMRPSLREDRKRFRLGDQEVSSLPLEGGTADFVVSDSIQGFGVVRHGLRPEESRACFRREIGRRRFAEAAGKACRSPACRFQILRGEGSPEKEEIDVFLPRPAGPLQLQFPQVRAKILAELRIFQRNFNRGL